MADDLLTRDERLRLEALAQSIQFHAARAMVSPAPFNEERVMASALAFEGFLKHAPEGIIPTVPGPNPGSKMGLA